MKRKISIAAAGVLSAAALFSPSVYANNIKIEIDGKTVESDTAPQITAEGRTIVPLRVISENLGAQVDWNAEEKTVIVTKDVMLYLTIGAKEMKNGRETIALDSPAQIVNNRTMVPLRAISESFGCNVAWDAMEKKVTITRPEDNSDDAVSDDTKKTTSTLPKYTYSGDEKYADVVCENIIAYTEDHYDAADVAIPIPLIFEVNDKYTNDIKVWGDFWVLNYTLNGDTLECESGGAYPGCMHFKKTGKGYEMTEFDAAADGEDFLFSLERICEGRADLMEKFSEDQESREALRKTIIEEYVKDNDLDIKAYKDYGWDPVLLGTSGDKEKSDKKDSAENAASDKAAEGSFGEEVPSLYEFSSGAGGWGTELTLEKDGSFVGTHLDSDMGDTGEGYPDGTVYICEFSGKFSDIKKNADGSYTMTLSELNVKEEAEKEWIENDIRYISSSPYGLEDGKEFILYTPDTPLESLSEEFLSWWPGRYTMDENAKTLGYYGIYNKETEYGFFASQYPAQ